MATNKRPPQAPQKAVLTPEEKRNGITRLRQRVAELQTFDIRAVKSGSDPTVKGLETSIEATLASVFGPGTHEYNRLRGAAQLDKTFYGVALVSSRQDRKSTRLNS